MTWLSPIPLCDPYLISRPTQGQDIYIPFSRLNLRANIYDYTKRGFTVNKNKIMKLSQGWGIKKKSHKGKKFHSSYKETQSNQSSRKISPSQPTHNNLSHVVNEPWMLSHSHFSTYAVVHVILSRKTKWMKSWVPLTHYVYHRITQERMPSQIRPCSRITSRNYRQKLTQLLRLMPSTPKSYTYATRQHGNYSRTHSRNLSV